MIYDLELRKTIYATFFVAMVLSSIVSGGGIVCGNANFLSHQTQKNAYQESIGSRPIVSPLPRTPPYASRHGGTASPIEPVTCLIIGIAVTVVVAYFTTSIALCKRDHLWIGDPDFDVVDDGDGIQVGDYFKVEGTVSGYAGKKGHTNKVEIMARAGRGNGDWDWEETEVHKFKDGGNFDLSFAFSDDQGRGFQAGDVGTLVVEVRAKVTGYRGTWWCWPFEEKETKDSGWVQKTRTIYSPYSWSVSGPQPGAVYHPPHPTQPTKSSLTSTLTSKTSATLEGYLYIDEEEKFFSLNKEGSDQLSVEKSHPCWPHIVDKSFYFENIKIDARIVLDNGQYWSNSETKPDKEVTCHGSVNLTPYPDVIDWGYIYVSTPRYEGQELGFEFNITGLQPSGVSYTWDFDDGSSPATGRTTTHTYQNDGLYNVSITAEWPSNSLTEFAYVNIDNSHPTIDSISVVDEANQGQIVSFASTASDPGVNDALTYTWTFGDGGSDTGDSVTHVYSGYGVFGYVLTVTDDHKGFDTSSGIIWIKGTSPVPNAGPPYTGDEGSPIQFDGSGSTDSDGTVFGWIWDFGDGTFGYGKTTTHTYVNNGTYYATLTVMDNNALESTTATATVGVNDVVPEFLRIAFDYETQYRVRFSADYNTPNPFINLTYSWNFGDGSSEETGHVVEHTYPTATNTYTVTLTVDDGDSPVQKTEQISIPAGSGKVSSFSLDVDPSYREVKQGGSTTYDVKATSIKNFSSPLTMTVTGLPDGAWGTFEDLRSLHPVSNMTLLITTTTSTPGGTYTLTIRGENGSKASECTCTLEVTVHDVAVISVTASPMSVPKGQTVTITVVVKNEGTSSESFSVTAKYDNTAIDSQTVTNLSPEASQTLYFYWDTGVTYIGTYKIKAEASTVPDETDTADNTKINGDVTVTLPVVGGVVVPIDKLALLAPYIALAIAVVAITIGAVYVKKRWLGKAVVQRP